jgi:phosphatidylglycerophosphate synthase
MIEHHIRPRIQPIFDAIGAQLVQRAICPNSITKAAFFTGAGAASALALGYNLLSMLLLLFSGLCDILDGTVARLTKKQHPFGAYMDLISDRMVEAMMILAFSRVYPEHSFAYLLFLTAVLFHFSTFVAAGALFPNDGHKSIHCDHSIVERAEALIVFCIMLLFPETIFYILMGLNSIIIASACNRYRRVKAYCLKRCCDEEYSTPVFPAQHAQL